MPRDTPQERRNVRIAISVLNGIAPACVLYWASTVASYSLFGRALRMPVVLETWALAETLFYGCIYLPQSLLYRRAARHPATPARKHRREIFDLCNTYIPDPEAYLNMWFLGAPQEEIKRDNMKDFFLWALFNRGGPPGADDDELEEYCRESELVLQRPLEPGRGNAQCLRLTLDPVQFRHRSLVWYFLVAIIDHITFNNMQRLKFEYYRTALTRFFHLFPARPQTLWGTKRSPAKHLTYWHRPHTSKTRMPVVFLHGVGVGLYPYAKFLAEINKIDGETSDPSNQIGIIAIELMAVSSRLTECPLDKDTMAAEVETILKHHGWDQSKVVLVSHSYGSVVTSHLLKSPAVARYVGPVLLIDPVTISLHLPDVAYNFTRRTPKKAFELLLWYFASMDMGISRAMCRHLFWHDSILWAHEMTGHDMTVALASMDAIVPTEHVGRYVSTLAPEYEADMDSDSDSVLQSQSQSTVLVKASDGTATPMSGYETLVPLSTAQVKTTESAEGTLVDLTDGLPTPNSDTDGELDKPAVDISERIRLSVQKARRACPKWKETDKEKYDGWKSKEWVGKGTEILWFEGLDHAQAVMKRKTRRQLIDVIRTYCAADSKSPTPSSI